MILCSYYMTAKPSYTYESNKQECIEQGLSELPLERDTRNNRAGSILGCTNRTQAKKPTSRPEQSPRTNSINPRLFLLRTSNSTRSRVRQKTTNEPPSKTHTDPFLSLPLVRKNDGRMNKPLLRILGFNVF